MGRVTIIGLGRVGRCLGISLRRTALDLEVIGHDRDYRRAREATRLGAVDRSDWNLPETLEGTELLVVAVPTGEIAQVFRDIAPHLEPGTVVTDVASTKVNVMALAHEILPGGVSFIGGHPIIGGSYRDPGEADASLLAGATYCLVVPPTADPGAVRQVTSLVEAAGAVPYFIDPHEHDSYAAAVAHLPALLAIALMDTVATQRTWPDLQSVAGDAFASVSLPAAGDPTLTLDSCAANRDAILGWIEQYQERLRALAAQVGSGEGLEDTVVRACRDRGQWVDAREAGRADAKRGSAPLVELPTSSALTEQTIFGTLMRRLRRWRD